jgi:MFS family permease
VSALKSQSFRRLWFAGLISDTGDWLLLVSLPILVYRYTGSTLGTSVVFLVELVPPVLLAPLAGSIADRFDRRRTLMLVSAAQAAALMPLLLVHGRAGLPIVYLVVIAQAALASVFDPTKSALMPLLVGSRQLVSANSLVGLNQNVGRLIGGSLGGILLAAGGGLPTIVVIDLISFVAAAGLISTLVSTPTRHTMQSEPLYGAPPSPGWWAERTVRGGLAVLLVASVAQGMFVVLSIVFVVGVLHGGPDEIGLLRGVQAIGAIGAALALSTAPRVRAGTLTAWAAAIFGLLDLAIWNPPELTRSEPLYVLLFVAVGAPGLALVAGLTTAVQQATAEGQRGKTFAAMGGAMAIGQAGGMLLAGVLGESVGVVTLLNIQGSLYLLAAGMAARWLRPRHRRHRPAPNPGLTSM